MRTLGSGLLLVSVVSALAIIIQGCGGTLSSRPLLVLLIEPSDRPHTVDESTIRDRFFGPDFSASDFFRDESRGHFTYRPAQTLRWYTTVDNPLTPGLNESTTAYQDVEEIRKKRAYFLRDADRFVDFSLYDANGDGVVKEDELSIVWMGTEPSPANARVAGTDPETIRTADGVSLQLRVAALQESSPMCTIVHELAHMTGREGRPGDTREEGPFVQPFYVGPGPYDLVSDECKISPAIPHLAPYHKVKLGWITPRPIVSDGWISIDTVEATGRSTLFKISNPARPSREYLLVENRYPMTGASYESAELFEGFDKTLPFRGLAIWHIDEDEFGLHGMDGLPIPDERDQMKLLRAPCADLWEGNLSCWQDFTFKWKNEDSGGALRCLSQRGPSMRVFVDLPGGRDVKTNCQPDLQFSPSGSVAFLQRGTTVQTLVVGEPATIRVKIQNRGTRTTACFPGSLCPEPTQVEVREDTPIGSQSRMIRVLMSDENENYDHPFFIDWTPLTPEQHKLTIVIDAVGEVKELDEGNNTMELSVQVCATRDLACPYLPDLPDLPNLPRPSPP